MELVGFPGGAFLAKIAKLSGAPTTVHLVFAAPFLIHSPVVMPGDTFVPEQPFVLCGPALL